MKESYRETGTEAWDPEVEPHSNVASPLIPCVICYKLFKISEPRLSYLLDEEHNNFCLTHVFEDGRG